MNSTELANTLQEAMLALNEDEQKIFLYCDDQMESLVRIHGHPALLALKYAELMFNDEWQAWQANKAMTAIANTPCPEKLQ